MRVWEIKDWGGNHPVEQKLDEARANNFDASLLSSGVMNPEHLRMNPKAISL